MDGCKRVNKSSFVESAAELHSSNQSLGRVRILPDLAVRLQLLFGLHSAPNNSSDLATLVKAKWLRSAEHPEIRSYLGNIVSGKETFGRVDYQTNHVVRATGERAVYTACALDAIIEGFFKPVRIESTCPQCQTVMLLRMVDGKATSVEPKSPVLWLGASQRSGSSQVAGCSCETDCCPYINLFPSKDHLAPWKRANPKQIGMALTLNQALWLAREGWWKPISSALLKPGKDEARASALIPLATGTADPADEQSSITERHTEHLFFPVTGTITLPRLLDNPVSSKGVKDSAKNCLM